MTSTLVRRAVAIGLAGAIVTGAVATSQAAPAFNNHSFRAFHGSQVTDVRWRRGGGVAAGVAAGLIVGGIAAAAASPRYYGPPAYYYEPAPVYAPPPTVYYEEPAYYDAPYGDPNGPTRRCWVSTDSTRGYGYWRAC